VAIDGNTRKITLKGAEVTLITGSKVRNFDQFKHSGRVIVEFYQAFAIATGGQQN